MKFVFSLIILLSALAVNEGQAQAAPYSTIGAGCVPDDNSIQGNRYDTGGHGLFAKYNKTARFICNIPDPSSIYGYFYMYYGNTVPSGKVTVKLKSSLFGSTLTTTHSTCTSSTSVGYTVKNCYMYSSPSSSRHYWFEVTIARTNGTTANPEFLGVRYN